mmetsp:Transcript_12862/g.39255  ORF Transcript_12862/g.39255 Transcript_12862/m.39255 type:complete len:200 (-) Transcript_12862:2-601(-)
MPNSRAQSAFVLHTDLSASGWYQHRMALRARSFVSSCGVTRPPVVYDVRAAARRRDRPASSSPAPPPSRRTSAAASSIATAKGDAAAAPPASRARRGCLGDKAGLVHAPGCDASPGAIELQGRLLGGRRTRCQGSTRAQELSGHGVQTYFPSRVWARRRLAPSQHRPPSLSPSHVSASTAPPRGEGQVAEGIEPARGIH